MLSFSYWRPNIRLLVSLFLIGHSSAELNNLTSWVFVFKQNISHKWWLVSQSWLSYLIRKSWPTWVFHSRTDWPTTRTSILGWIDFVHLILSIISSCFFELTFQVHKVHSVVYRSTNSLAIQSLTEKPLAVLFIP